MTRSGRRTAKESASTAGQFRPFNLLRYFILTALAAVLLWSAGLGLLLSWLTREALLTLGERHAVEVTEHLYAQLYGDVLTPLLNGDVDKTIVGPAIAENTSGLNVARIDIYDLAGRLRYSTDASVTALNVPGDEFYMALATRAPVSLLERAGELDEQTGRRHPHDLIETYVPFYTDEDQTLAGVFEVYQDVSALVALSHRAGWMVTAAAVAGMGLLFLTLLVIVRRADRIIQSQTATLARQNEALQQLQQTKDDLTRMLVHDLKNPLTVIMGALSLVRVHGASALSPQLADWLRRAERNGKTMLDLVENILDISRLEEGRLIPAANRCTAEGIILPPLETLTGLATEEGKVLTVDAPQGLPPLQADRMLLQRVVGNLVSNALKYADSQVGVVASVADGAFCVAVTDDGPGVPPAWRERIFGKFAQAGGEHQRPGTGLGLAFCKLAVEAHGGRIWVEETADGDTQFVFTIPPAG